MTTRISLLGLLATLLCGCGRTDVIASQSETVALHPVHTVCSILEPGAHFSDPHITVRGRLLGGMHEILLKDSTCNNKALLLRYIAGGPHFLFCESERLTREFGCPGGVNGPIVTVRGVLSAGRGSNPETGIFAIEEVLAYESTRTGKAVSP
jgi:hypothetical protein